MSFSVRKYFHGKEEEEREKKRKPKKGAIEKGQRKILDLGIEPRAAALTRRQVS